MKTPVSVAATARWRAHSTSPNLNGTILFRKSLNANSVVIYWLKVKSLPVVENAPGASLFGPVADLVKEAERRQNMTGGKYYEFPVSEIASKKIQIHKAKNYIPNIYGKNRCPRYPRSSCSPV